MENVKGHIVDVVRREIYDGEVTVHHDGFHVSASHS